MATRYEVIHDWTATYRDPIKLRASDPLELSGKEYKWDGHLWLWARGADGKEGWIPESICDIKDGSGHARKDFDAMELTCKAGERLTGLAQNSGWARCKSTSGREGWVPLRNLKPL